MWSSHIDLSSEGGLLNAARTKLMAVFSTTVWGAILCSRATPSSVAN